MDVVVAQRVADEADDHLPLRELVLVSLVVGIATLLAEADRLIAAFNAQGYSASLTTASGPRLPIAPWGTADPHPWIDLHNLERAADRFVLWFTVADWVFAACYGLLLFGLLIALRSSRTIGDAPPLRLVTLPRPFLIWVAVAFDVAENFLLLAIALAGDPGEPMSRPLAAAASLMTFLKWATLLVALIPFAYAAVATIRGRTWVKRWSHAVYRQRFSRFAVVPIGTFALVSGPGLFDQIPDVQRAWFVVDADRGWSGILHATVAIVVLAMVAFGLFVLGRLFTDDAIRRTVDETDRPRTVLQQWLFGPAVVVVGALVVVALGGSIRWPALIIFCAVPLVIALMSWWLRRNRPGMAMPPAQESQLPVSEIWRVGDMLALSGIVLASLGLVRSHAVLMLLGEGNPVQVVMPIVGLAAAWFTWVMGVDVFTRVGDISPVIGRLIVPMDGASITLTAEDTADGRAPTNPEQRRPWLLAWGCIVISTAWLAVMALFPTWMAGWAGVLGVVMMGIGSLMLLVGASAVVHNMYAPPEIFWTRGLKLHEAPVASLLTVVVLGAMTTGSSAEIHGVRLAQPAVTATTSYRQAADEWLARIGDCTVEAPGGGRARPLVLVAAEGGGIRAAYWTAAALEVLGEETECGVEAIAVASGVSGGSVGLAVARARAVEGSAEAVWRMGDPDALAEASLGLLVRDPFHTVTGVPQLIDGRWVDRAGLMERSWERTVPGLADDFYSPADDAGLAAPLVLNVTDATSGCRVLATHLDVGGDADAAQRCTDADAALPYSRDLRDYRGWGPIQPTDHCLQGINGSTAAMLSARFPYVTPSGVLGPCGDVPRAQLIDGGYAEGTGLGSLVDLGPRLLREVPGDVTVLPIVVFLDNGRGGDLLPIPPKAIPELLVPPVGALTAAGTQNSTAAWLQRARALAAGPNVLRPEVFVVAQGSEPAVEAPLGWVLSQASRADMDSSLAGFVEDACVDGGGATDDHSQDHQDMPALLRLLGACD